MEYPIFELPFLGGSMAIACIAIFHVFIAHFSVGSGFLMAFAEKKALDDGDSGTLTFLRKYSFLVLLVPYVLGTVTGVGIWFTVAVVSPRAISLLIHQFVWFWAIEWVFFIIEVVSIHFYCFRWDSMDARAHNRVGWIFAISSLITLFIINAILTFQLTPGSWAPGATYAVWKAILNPTYIPTTILRSVVAFGLAGVFGIALMAFSPSVSKEVRERIVPLCYKFMLPSLLALPMGGWIFLALSPRAKTFLEGGAPVMLIFLSFGMAAFIVIHISAGLSLWRKDFKPSTLGACLLVLLAFISFGAFEFVREGVRKPFIVEGFMYSTGLTTKMAEGVDKRATVALATKSGVLRLAPWALPPGSAVEKLSIAERGQAVYKAACLRCHCVDGYNAMRPLVRGWSSGTMKHLLDHMAEVKSSMPDFPGTESEKLALIHYLLTLNPKKGGAAR